MVMALALAIRRRTPTRGIAVPAIVLTGVLIGVLSVGPVPSAFAQSKSDLALARKAYKKGEAAFQAGRYEEALAEFQKGYALSKKELFLLNIGYAHEQLGNYAEALDFYERYRATNPPADELPELEARIVECRAQLPTPVSEPAPDLVPKPAPEPEPVLIATPEKDAGDQPIYKTWYFWAGVGAVVVLGVVVGVAASSSEPDFQSRGTWGVLPGSAWGGSP